MTRLQKQMLTLKHEEGGMAAVEFALIAPVFILMLVGTIDISHSVYMQSVLEGEVQKAARDSALETARDIGLPEEEESETDRIDAKVERAVRNLSSRAFFKIDRESYYNFNDVDRAEKFTDNNKDGECNNNEPFEDENSNGSWDDDVGDIGIGGPKDIVQYTVTVAYPGIFSGVKFEPKKWEDVENLIKASSEGDGYGYFGFNSIKTMSTTTVLKNQPYGQQDPENTSTPDTCS